MINETDVIIVGSGVAGLFGALNIPSSLRVLIITKKTAIESDSYLAQGGICVLKNKRDFNSFFADTMKAGHYENNPASVELMINSSRDMINELINYGVDFERKDGKLVFTREGAHSASRILFHDDITGREITDKLLRAVQARKNITISENTTMLDIISKDNTCFGVVARDKTGEVRAIRSSYVMLACGGLGGLFEHSTNFRHITGDAIAIALKHKIELENINYIQIHPTTLYSPKPGRRFLISESVRGEGAYLFNLRMNRFVDELLPRDILTEKIKEQMKNEGGKHVWLSVAHLGAERIKNRFPNIYNRCLEEGYDITKDCIPVTPALHYFMGGIKVCINSKTSMNNLYAVGETSCNGVHGANRLASNSLLESLVFANRAAADIAQTYKPNKHEHNYVDLSKYKNIEEIKQEYKQIILEEIERVEGYEKLCDKKSKCG